MHDHLHFELLIIIIITSSSSSHIIIITHYHIMLISGASTDEAQVNVARDIANQMCDVFDQRDYYGVVNVSYLSASTQVHMKPFMVLAEKIGAMQVLYGGGDTHTLDYSR